MWEGIQIFARRFKRNQAAVLGLIVVVFILIAVVLAPMIAPYDYRVQRLDYRLQNPSRDHLLGTDEYGRDVLSRIIMGARVSVYVGFSATALVIVIGSAVGLVAGSMGGRTDWLLMRITDIFMSVPSLFLMIVVVALFGPSLRNTILVIGLVNWTGTARLVRAGTLSIRELDFIDAAQAIGATPGRIIRLHILPNVAAPIIVQGSLFLGRAILYEASLSYLQLGAQPPTPSWGNMVADAQRFLSVNWWQPTWPGLAILVTVLAFNLLGDGIRDALDPKLVGSQ